MAKDEIWGGPNLHMDFFPQTFIFPSMIGCFIGRLVYDIFGVVPEESQCDVDCQAV